ncbi:MAG: site-2 protease family protein [Calditrichaeota bacterium]|nr:MAG: site-2 protease family protein [Calditrichota bacterium]
MNVDLGNLILWYVAFLFSVTAHEAAHSFVAMRGGDLTAYLGGQVSLNPVPHIKRSPFGTVIIPLLSYIYGGWMIGWASAPYDPNWAATYPRKAAWMAAAGPAANFIILSVAFIIIKLGLLLGVFQAPHSVNISRLITANSDLAVTVATLLSILFMLNLILFIFNLFPFPPLDGSQVITLIMGEDTAQRFRQFINQPAMSFLGIILAWKLFGSVFSGIFSLILKLIYPSLRYF